MDENTPPSTNGSPLENALKQIQNWFVSGDFAKVKQGCEEVLKAAPNNSIAQDLLKKAGEALATLPEPPMPPMPEPVEAPTPEPVAEPAPLPGPTTETTDELPDAPGTMPAYEFSADGPAASPVPPMPEPVEAPMPEPVAVPPMPMPEAPIPEPIPHEEASEIEPIPEEHHKGKSLIVNLIILLVVIALGVGGVYGYHTFFGDDAEDTPSNQTETTPQETEIEEDGKPGNQEDVITEKEEEEEEEAKDTPETRNEQRKNDLTKIETALSQYYNDFREYPLPSEIQTILVDKGYLAELPAPPTTEEQYVYAVYGTPLGPLQVFILSAEFEEDEGVSIWSLGGNEKEYTDFRDLTKENVVALNETTAEPDEPTAEPVRQRVPRS